MEMLPKERGKNLDSIILTVEAEAGCVHSQDLLGDTVNSKLACTK